MDISKNELNQTKKWLSIIEAKVYKLSNTKPIPDVRKYHDLQAVERWLKDIVFNEGRDYDV